VTTLSSRRASVTAAGDWLRRNGQDRRKRKKFPWKEARERALTCGEGRAG